MNTIEELRAELARLKAPTPPNAPTEIMSTTYWRRELAEAEKALAAQRAEINKLRQWLRFAGLNPDDLDGQGFPKAMPTEAQANAVQRESETTGLVHCKDCSRWQPGRDLIRGWCAALEYTTNRDVARNCTMFEAQ